MTWSTQLETCVTPRLPTLGRKFRKIVLTCAERVSSAGRSEPTSRATCGSCTATWRRLPATAPQAAQTAIPAAPVFAPATTRATMIAPFQRTGAA